LGGFAYLIRQPAARRLSDRYLDAAGRLDIRSVGQPGSYLADRLIFSNANTYTLTDPAVGFLSGDQISDFHRTDAQSAAAADLIKCRMADKSPLDEPFMHISSDV